MSLGEDFEKLPAIDQLVEVMRRLRGPGGCPWDKKQTHASLKKYMIEEGAELMDSIDEGNPDGVCDELGDLLMHITFHSVIAEENDEFSFDDVAKGSVEKMIRRHPHVFGDVKVEHAEEVPGVWEEMKKKEGRPEKESILDGIPDNLPSLLQAEKVQKRGAEFGFDWDNQLQIIEKIDEEIAEVKEAVVNGNEDYIDEEIGDLLFAVVNLARFRKRDSSDELLRLSIRKFKRRFKFIEKSLVESGKSLETATIDEMEEFWNEAKESEK